MTRSLSTAMRKSALILVTLSFFFWNKGLNATASEISAVGFNLGATTLASFGDGTIGWEFVPTANIWVTKLGYVDVLANGLLVSHPVGIWDDNQSLIVSTVVQAGTASSLTDNFRYEPVAQTLLLANETYVIGARVGGQSPGNDDNYGVGGLQPLPPGFHIEPELDLVGGRTNGGNASFVFPGVFFRADHIYLGPNFQYSLEAIPEPSTFVLAGLGLLSLSCFALRKKYRRGS